MNFQTHQQYHLHLPPAPEDAGSSQMSRFSSWDSEAKKRCNNPVGDNCILEPRQIYPKYHSLKQFLPPSRPKVLNSLGDAGKASRYQYAIR